jgi:esterase/lipase superfamily enzyme
MRCKNWSCPTCQLHPRAEVLRFGSSMGQVEASGFVAYDPDLDKIIVAFSGTRVTDIASW